MVIDKLLHELGHRWHAYVQLAGELREYALAIESHIGNNVALYDVVLVCDALEICIGINIEKLGQ
jgi:hypothetical protein